ncbi:LysR family transcriptional regulator [Desulfitobacterium chlororespirans]|uniref:Transcriptional regulator, LysR family n=1 Tax=Desulfitobacterium chlororespirans DSM 11544 TaxID=1121395 RepID=A0A1M7TMJ2_9FIRM|nr:LysR family transcriptional regulator [Desulfitobacterium chlororespirans]SHN71981.1 transcriptional regulator, LysR family [Desulfitobacterium chlororespirans DSM 11544]
MRIEQLDQIVKIYEHGSLSKAANALFISQPSLSISVSRLEEELGLKIFERSNIGVAPTEQGEAALELARNILTLSEKIKGMMDGRKVLIRNLQIAIPGAFANAIAPDLLMKFRELYPEVNLHIHEAPYYEIVENMDRGAYSIGVIPCGQEGKKDLLKQLNDVEIEWEIISGGQAKLMLFLSSKNPLADKERISFSDIRSMKMISYKENYIQTSRNLRCPLHKPIIVEDIELLKRLISADFGFSIFPEILSYNDLYMSSGMIKAIPMHELSEQWDIFILYSHHESLSFIERELLALVKELIRDNLISQIG